MHRNNIPIRAMFVCTYLDAHCIACIMDCTMDYFMYCIMDCGMDWTVLRIVVWTILWRNVCC
jgi:hypothetical protein